jgi:hypothetical protein
MSAANVLVNDTVRIKVHFVDINSVTEQQVDVNPISVAVKIYNSSDQQVVSGSATSLTSSTFYYDYKPNTAGEYRIQFVGTLSDGTLIVVEQQLYVSTSTVDYRPTVTLRATETIYFSADIAPLYVDPELLLPYFPEASVLQVGEIIHYYSKEVTEIYTSSSNEIVNNGSSLNFTAQEYIKAATACELSRTYGYGGGDDEVSVRLGDLEIRNRNSPRSLVTRANAVTWCQIATALRSEMIAHKIGAKGVVIRNSNANIPNPSTVDPLTGTSVYLSETGLYTMGTNGNLTIDPNGDNYSNPDRTLKKYD